MLAIFMVVLFTSPGLGPRANLLVTQVVGPAFALVVGTHFLRRPFVTFPPEFKLYVLFLGTSISGFLVALNLSSFWYSWTLVAQIALVFFCIMCVTRSTHSPHHPFVAYLVTALVVIAVAFSNPTSRASMSLASNQRLAYGSLWLNANGVGYVMMIGIISAVYLAPRARSGLSRALLGGAGSVSFLFLVFSGSRKAFLASLAFLVVLIAAQVREGMRRRYLVGLLVALLSLVAVAKTAEFILERSYLGERMAEYQTIDELMESKRALLIREGFGMFARSPVIGVGLGQFQVYSEYRAYAHSDVVEVLATTGLLGTSVYLWIYPVLWRRLTRLLRVVRHRNTRHELHVFRAMIVAIVLIGLGRPLFLDLLSMFVLSTIVSSTYWLERRYRTTSLNPLP